MKVVEAQLDGVLLIDPVIHHDFRGQFAELYEESRYHAIGVEAIFVQDNISFSSHGVIRGLHYQTKNPQGKLVTCLRGSIFDVVVDVRKSSTTAGRAFTVVLDEKSFSQIWIPPGFAHGFAVLSEDAVIQYKCTEFYSPSSETGVRWNDDSLSIRWPVQDPVISQKDRLLPLFNDIELVTV